MGQPLKSKSVLVVGASSGIGVHVVQTLVGEGHRLVAHYNSSTAGLERLAGPALHLERADLTRDDQARRLVERAGELLGGIDALVNLVGPYAEEQVLDMSPTTWRAQLELNLNVPFAVCHFAQPALVASRGQIVNFCYAGAEALRPWREAAAYGAAKAGLVVLTKSLAQALAPYGVRVNAVSPGYVDGDHFSPDQRALIARKIPQGRLTEPSEVAALVQWLLCASPASLTGAFLNVGGGWEHD